MLSVDMLRKLNYAALFFTCLILVSACTAPVLSGNTVNGKPYWFWNPNDGNLLGGIGEAGTHINGLNAQRQLAISRAIEDIARQKGVVVSSVQTISQHASESSSSVALDVYSVQTVSGITVTAQVREFWVDPATKRLMVWMTETK